VLVATASFAQLEGNAYADPKAVVVSGQARFTVLTPQLVRMEWSDTSLFENRASLVFINRRLPVPAFTTTTSGGWFQIKTQKLLLKYKADSGQFTARNLSVALQLDGKTVEWHPGMEDTGNLQGTLRTLDGVKGSTKLEPGLVSRDGWVLVDDTNRPLFDKSDWPWVVARPPGNRQDWYFFGYGHDYKQALGDFVRVAGRIPLPPRFAFGTWWSRYWSYTDQEFKQLINEFEQHDVPLDVLVVDMDWHLTFGTKWWENKKDQSGHSLGWTGYTWNTLLFPDPPEFLSWVHDHGLKTTLNMHPASGVQPHEEAYPAMAEAMGIDPATKKYVPFDITNKKFATNYMKILHHPLERQGVDFFWLDWQQEPTTAMPGLNPTWWLNYVHFTDMEREGKRPLIYHRWGGLGNHRYEIGFSGDTVSVWESLAFQPYFTATAANVGYGYWSHDIGGHMPGEVAPELYTRWVQWGVFSPILRTHTTKNPNAERRIWAYPPQYAETMRDAFLLRYALIPYIYTAAREAYDTGISMLRPMYYDYPEAPEAYDFKDEYMYGDDLLVSPVVAALSAETGMATNTVWLPPGAWIEWFTGARLQGPARLERSFTLGEIPVYVKAGAIVPEQPKMRHTGEKPVDPLILTIFPGDTGSAKVYEDAGNDLGYKKDEFAFTTVRHALDNGAMKIEILPVEGRYPAMLTQRQYEIRLPGSLPPASVSYNGAAVSYTQKPADQGNATWHYDGNTLTTVIAIPESALSERIEIVVEPNPGDARLADGFAGRMARLKAAMDVLNGSWPQGWSPDSLIEAVQTGERIDLSPTTAVEELQKLNALLPQVITDIQNQKEVDAPTRTRALAHLGEMGKAGKQ
jgi:alpha-glucosidase